VVARELISHLLDHLDYFFCLLHRKQLGLRLLQVVFHTNLSHEKAQLFFHMGQVCLPLLGLLALTCPVASTATVVVGVVARWLPHLTAVDYSCCQTRGYGAVYII
jgi:hypothetical protein